MAWRRQRPEPEPAREPVRPAVQTPAAPAPSASTERKPMEKLVNIGKSIQIKGELTGKEDLTIEGRVDGKIVLKDHHLTIGANGHITAEIHAKSVSIVGQVVGNVTADDRIEIAATGSMEGDIKAPRVVLADGARFKGAVDMERSGGSKSASSSSGSGSSAGSGGGTANMPRSASGKG